MWQENFVIMNKLINTAFILLILLLSSNAYSQILQPVEWNFSSSHIGGNEYELVFEASIDDGWAVYSQYLESDDGPIATSFTFEEMGNFELVGKVEEDETNRKKVHDAVFKMELIKFYKKGVFRQKVKGDGTPGEIKGYLNFMTCDDERCLPPEDVDFSFAVANATEKKGEQKSSGSGANADTGTPVTPSALVVNEVETKLYGIDPIDLENTVNECDTESLMNTKKSKSLLGIFLLGILGGLLALLTPCVFPMIPLTVSFFTKSHDSKNKGKGMRDAFLYGFFIFLVYAVLSAPFHLLDSVNPDILNEISTNVWLNIAFFAIFLFFAFSFFGYYELTIPASWTNKVSSAEGIGGFLGIFFMAMTLALVSFSCTGPILGSLLAGAMSSQGGAWQLTAGMSGFGMALALPFGLFAMFPGWMKKLPRSGGWLNSVKVVLGFLELALALKFLSNADLVKHWGLLKIEPFLLLWIIIFIGMGLYLFGKIKFPHDSPIKKLSFTRISLGILSIAFAVYLASGFIYDKEKQSFSSLKLLSGLAPPVGYSWIYPKDCPNNLNCFKDFSEGLAYAKKEGKPIMVDFTGYACVNCRKMEEHIWPNKRIYNYINEDFVLISLYVDDKKELPEAEQIEVERVQGGTRKLRNYGHKWAHFQTKYFGTNSQPYYALLSSDGTKLLNTPVAYTPDVESYANFLECGKEASQQITNRSLD